MNKTKSNWKLFQHYLKKFDFFGESFTFRYKDEDKQSTELGGLMNIIFYLVAIIYFGINFKPFLKEKNFTLQYYSTNIEKTEDISLTKMSFAFGLTNQNNTNNESITDFLEIKVNYTIFNRKNESIDINLESCNKLHLPNVDDKRIEENMKCINRDTLLKHSPKDIFGGNDFSFYEIYVQSKDKNNETLFEKTREYLTQNDCKLQFYYTDISFDASKNDSFITSFNSMFIQLNPTLIQKRNIYFLNYHSINDKEVFHLTSKEDDEDLYLGLSRFEDYALYKGLDRGIKEKSKDYEIYAKMYLRVDNRKVYIKRKYQDFMEFYADNSGLLLSVFWILGVSFAYFDRMKANHSISKRLFYFEGITNNKFKEFKELKEQIKKNEEGLNNGQGSTNTRPVIYVRNNTFSGGRNPNTDSNILRNNYIRRNTTAGLNPGNNNLIINQKKLIDYSYYNIFEMIGGYDFCICKSKKLKKKINLINQANSMINGRLDIVFYIRNMILFEKINEINLENKNIFNFLSRPIIYFDNKKAKYQDEINDTETNTSIEIIDIAEETMKEKPKSSNYSSERYSHSYQLNMKILSKKIGDLILKKDKKKDENKLLCALKRQLKGVE